VALSVMSLALIWRCCRGLRVLPGSRFTIPHCRAGRPGHDPAYAARIGRKRRLSASVSSRATV